MLSLQALDSSSPSVSSWYDTSNPSFSSSSGISSTSLAPVGQDDLISVIAQITQVVHSTRGGVVLEQTQRFLNHLETVGQGATFNVKAVRYWREDASPWHQILDRKSDFRHDVVYKRLRRFPTATANQRAAQIRTIILELQILSHSSLTSHENIVRLIGLGFEPSFSGDSEPWPVLILERAQHGTLNDLQQSKALLAAKAKFDLSLDVALGLAALHESGVVHGDIKSENILVFDHAQRVHVAKIADFGFALLDQNESAPRPQGTFPWQAPELLTRQYLAISDLAAADIYSFGLLHLRLAIDGHSPLETPYVPTFESQVDKKEFVRNLKLSTEFSLLDHLLDKVPEAKIPLEMMYPTTEILRHSIQISREKRNLNLILSILRANASPRAAHSKYAGRSLGTDFGTFVQEQTTITNFVSAQFDFGTQKALLEASKRSANRVTRYEDVMRSMLSSNRKVFDNFMKEEESNQQHTSLRSCMQVFEMYALGLGADQDFGEALRWYQMAIECGDIAAAGDLKNLYEAFGIPFKCDSSISRYIKMSAFFGHRGGKRSALELGLMDDVQDNGLNSNALLRDLREKCFPGSRSTIAFHNILLFRRQLATYLKSANCFLSKWTLTPEKDSLLHCCVMANAAPEIILLLLKSGVDINFVNSEGVTPLIQACKDGNIFVANLLLDNEADPKLCDLRGASALHALVAADVDPKQLRETASTLISRGLDVNVMAAHGSPLHDAVMAGSAAAVQVLLELGASTRIGTGQLLRPMDLAASLHHCEILKLMIEADPEFDFKEFNPADGNTPLAAAVLVPQVHTMKIHGASYSDAFINTVLFLQERVKWWELRKINNRGQTLIHAAVMSRSEALVQKLIGTDAMREVNIACTGLTPLEMAIRWHRKSIFRLLLPHVDVSDWRSLEECARDRFADLDFARALLEQKLTRRIAGHGTIVHCDPIVLYTALVHKNYAMAELLFSYSYNVNMRLDLDNYETVFSRILSEGPDIDCLSFILELTGKAEANFEVHEQFTGCILHVMCQRLTNPLDAALHKQVFHRVLQKYHTANYLDFTGISKGEPHLVGAPLHVAVVFGNYSAVQALLTAGASVTLRNHAGFTALDIVDALLEGKSDDDDKTLKFGGRPVSRSTLMAIKMLLMQNEGVHGQASSSSSID